MRQGQTVVCKLDKVFDRIQKINQHQSAKNLIGDDKKEYMKKIHEQRNDIQQKRHTSSQR